MIPFRKLPYAFVCFNRFVYSYGMNFLLFFCKATCGIPEIAFTTFENMEYGEGLQSLLSCTCVRLLFSSPDSS